MEYQDAVCTLNMLPTNGSFRQQVGGERGAQQLQLQTMKDFLERAGLTVEELDHLNIIHVAGTKGKGSTCAFTEQILRSYGFRTGFYRKFPGFSMSSMEAKTGNSSILSSPHLVHVRERIRIQGQPISKDLFTKYFWQVYSRLDDTKDCHGGSMPPVFRFLTILAFHIFLQEKVDLAVIEVGIGGAYDCTNIIRRPWVCGISSLEIDHKNILGDTIEEIAWHKGGIFKPGVPAFTVKQQEGAMIVLQERAEEIGCSLSVCPELGDYTVDEGVLRLSLAGDHQRMNASLALQLSHSWLQRRCLPGPDKHLPAEFSGVTQAKSFKPSPVMLKGLAETEWPGRTQTLRHGPITYFLDGAHTMGSMRACAQWFIEASTQRELVVGGAAVRVLLFNVTGGRDAAAMLKLLEPHHFDFAVFCPIITETLAMCNADQQNFNVSVENMLCLNNQQSWRLLTEPREGQARPDVGEEANEAQLLISGNLPLVTEQQQRRRPGGDTLIFPCILSALQWITQARDPMLALPGKRVIPVKPSVAAKASPLRDATEIHVLITGSLHLVGGALTHLDPASAS